jgi:hypothetical protein
MGNVDGVPVASQVKSAVQLSRGDRDSAWATQQRFSERCIGAAQVRSVVEAAQGDHDAAAETQRKFLANASRLLADNEVIDAVPIVSQVKAIALARGGEGAAAAQSQRNFFERCPVVSQARSAYQFASGRPEEAEATQKEFLRFSSHSIDKIPGIGHLKAWAHEGIGRDPARAAEARLSATRATENVCRSFGSAVTDILGTDAYGAEAPPPPEAACNTCGPLDDATIRQNTFLFEISEDQMKSHGSCPICMIDFRRGEEALTLRCFHVFHPACADQWLLQNGNCPVCRVGAAPPQR